MKTVGIGTRVVDFLIDGFIIVLLSYFVYRYWSYQVQFFRYMYIPVYGFMALFTFLYYFILESISGRTLGKWVTVSRVVSADGSHPNVGQIFFRSLLRLFPLDFILIPWKNATVHDYLSKTRVVEN